MPDNEAVDKTGAGYISDDARAALRGALTNKQPGAVMQKKRLWCNLLSSQPLCFNLFGPLSEHVGDPQTNAALKAVWPDVDQITSINYEHSHLAGAVTTSSATEPPSMSTSSTST